MTKVVPDAALESDAMAVCRRIAAGPARAQATVKRLLFASLRNGLEEQMEIEGR